MAATMSVDWSATMTAPVPLEEKRREERKVRRVGRTKKVADRTVDYKHRNQDIRKIKEANDKKVSFAVNAKGWWFSALD